jgi:ferredoxin
VALILGRDEWRSRPRARWPRRWTSPCCCVPGAEVTPPRQTTWPVLQGASARRGASGRLRADGRRLCRPAPVVARAAGLRPGARRGGVALRSGDRPDRRARRCSTADPAGLSARRSARPRRRWRAWWRGRADGRHLRQAEIHRLHRRPLRPFAQPQDRLHALPDLCPTGAIVPAGDSVAIDPAICAGCGQCAAACPTGAAAYALPVVDNLAQRLRRGCGLVRGGGARAAPVILFHDEAHGAALIDASARFGRGLPAHVIPVQVNEPARSAPRSWPPRWPGARAACGCWQRRGPPIRWTGWRDAGPDGGDLRRNRPAPPTPAR